MRQKEGNGERLNDPTNRGKEKTWEGKGKEGREIWEQAEEGG